MYMYSVRNFVEPEIHLRRIYVTYHTGNVVEKNGAKMQFQMLIKCSIQFATVVCHAMRGSGYF